jgi:hypothetical protein
MLSRDKNMKPNKKRLSDEVDNRDDQWLGDPEGYPDDFGG